MHVTISGKKGETGVAVGTSDTVGDLRKAYAAVAKKDINSVALKHEGDLASTVRLDDDAAALSSVSVKNGTKLMFKDLGPQIGYRTVFYAEYGGPIVFVAIMALLRSQVFGLLGFEDVSGFEGMNWVAQLGVYCWTAHFVKRELETAFVHKFSRPTMPLSNLFKNCTYYWTFGAVIGWPLCSPNYIAPSENVVMGGLVLFILSELGNFAIHLKLANMRPGELSKKRDIPKGFGFDLVACPNYFFEVMSWVGFSIMTGIVFSWLFTIVGFLQMADWAMKKHKGYKKTYDKEYTSLKRKAIIPFIY
jgi:very-long-chain enoyl-CoA reductase